MKKFFIFFGLLLLIAAAAVSQVVDTTHLYHTQGESILAFLKNNIWSLALLVFAFVSEWLGQTGKVKEGSIYAWILNLIGRIIKSKAKMFNIQTKKGKFGGLRVIIFAIILSGIGITASAQGLFSGFFSPINDNPALNAVKKSKAEGLMGVNVKQVSLLIRPKVGFSAYELTYDKATKQWNGAAVNAVCFGMGLQHFNKDLVNDFGVNALVSLGTEESLFQTATGEKANIKGILALNVLNIANFGGGRNFTLGAWMLYTGITLKF